MWLCQTLFLGRKFRVVATNIPANQKVGCRWTSLDLARSHIQTSGNHRRTGIRVGQKRVKGVAEAISSSGYAIGIIRLSTCLVCWIQSVSENLAGDMAAFLRMPRLTLCLCIRIAERTLKEIVRVAHKTNGTQTLNSNNNKKERKEKKVRETPKCTHAGSHPDTSHTRVHSRNGRLKNLENKREKVL